MARGCERVLEGKGKDWMKEGEKGIERKEGRGEREEEKGENEERRKLRGKNRRNGKNSR